MTKLDFIKLDLTPLPILKQALFTMIAFPDLKKKKKHKKLNKKIIPVPSLLRQGAGLFPCLS